jgi:hypothetical protein
MHGVAPQCVVKVAYPSLGGEAGGRSLGFILLKPHRARGNRRAGFESLKAARSLFDAPA